MLRRRVRWGGRRCAGLCVCMYTRPGFWKRERERCGIRKQDRSFPRRALEKNYIAFVLVLKRRQREGKENNRSWIRQDTRTNHFHHPSPDPHFSEIHFPLKFRFRKRKTGISGADWRSCPRTLFAIDELIV